MAKVSVNYICRKFVFKLAHYYTLKSALLSTFNRLSFFTIKVTRAFSDTMRQSVYISFIFIFIIYAQPQENGELTFFV